ncbi:MAG: glycosyl hydrolase, partial [Bacteroidota bacterium]
GFHLYKPDQAYRMQQSSGWRKPNTKLVGENHPNGAILNFYLKNTQATDTVSLEILEMDGSLIQRFSNRAKENKLDPTADKPLKVKSGGNRLIWNMRYPGYKTFKGMVFYSSPNIGPKAVPGDYLVRLNYNGQSVEQVLTIIKDPRMPNTDEDYQEQFDFLIAIRDQVSRANTAIVDIRDVKKDLDYLKGKSGLKPGLKEMIADFESKLDIVENTIHMTKNQSRQDPLNYGIRINNRLAFLMADSQRGDYRPTDQAKEFFTEVTKELDTEIQALNGLMKEYVSKVNGQVSENNMEVISLKK